MTSSIHISKGRASMRSSSKRANQHTLYGTMIVKVIFDSISLFDGWRLSPGIDPTLVGAARSNGQG